MLFVLIYTLPRQACWINGQRDSSEKEVLADYTEEFGEDDYLTDGEEEVLRKMDALDDILDV